MASYQLVDIGANLTNRKFKDDLDEVLKRASDVGVVKIMITGCSDTSSKEAQSLAAKHPGFLYFTAGVHPHEAKTFDDLNTLLVLRELLANSQCVAVGECGLDFNRNFSPRDSQLHAFEQQVALACELQKPLFIHERDASNEMLDILTKYKEQLPPAVIHCFTGTADEAKRYIDMGLYIGLTGFIWKDRSENGVRYALANGIIPLDKLVIETDAPYMYPKINDKKIPLTIREKFSVKTKEIHKFSSFDRNEPSSLAATCELIAAFMGDVDAKIVADITTTNAKKIYGLH